MQAICAEDLKKLLDAPAGPIVIDARGPESFAEGHLPGAVYG